MKINEIAESELESNTKTALKKAGFTTKKQVEKALRSNKRIPGIGPKRYTEIRCWIELDYYSEYWDEDK